MELRDAVRSRRMIRTYDPGRPVPDELLTDLLDLAIRAPSAGFSQGWDFVVLHSPADIARFWQATAGDAEKVDRWRQGMRTAPTLVLCLADPGRYLDRYAEPDKGHLERDEAAWPIPYWDVDTGMAALLLLLGAVDAELAGCFFGVPPQRHDAVRQEFAVPADRRIVGVVSLGFPPPDGSDRRSPSLRRGRRPLTDVAHDGQFNRPWGGRGPRAGQEDDRETQIRAANTGAGGK